MTADGPKPERRFRIGERTYGASTAPLVDVLVQLYEWSLERRRREAADTPDPSAGTARAED